MPFPIAPEELRLHVCRLLSAISRDLVSVYGQRYGLSFPPFFYPHFLSKHKAGDAFSADSYRPVIRSLSEASPLLLRKFPKSISDRTP